MYRLGINHHLLFAESAADPATHERTLREVLAYPEFAVVDLYLAGDAAQQEREAALIRASGKQVVYNFPLLHLLPGCNPNATDPEIAERTRVMALGHFNAAATAGAKLVTVASGPNPAPAEHDAAWNGWIEYLAWAGEQAAARGQRVVIEPFDQSVGKNLLIGPTADAVRAVQEVRARGIETVGLMVDMGHLPIMGETFAQALWLSAPYLWHIHLGSAVLRDPAHPWYGDFHPPLGLPEGEHDGSHLTAFLRVLRAVGYLDAPGAVLTLEMRPYPDCTQRQSVERWLEMVAEAWQQSLA